MKLWGDLARLALGAGVVVVGVAAGPAFGQAGDPRRSDSGHLGRATNTDEVDSCKVEIAPDEELVKERAREHYERGVNLYDRGDYEAAIEEFVAAYCHKPAHQALNGIYQSFERLVSYEKAVAYLERYILEVPDDLDGQVGAGIDKRRYLSSRVEVLRNLPARVRVATVPPGATVKLIGESGVRASGLSSDPEPLKVPKGTYTMEITRPGYEPITQTIDVQIGQPYSYLFQLSPKQGQLRVIADPPDAEIFLRREIRETGEFEPTPERVGIGNYVDALPIGTYEVTLEADGRVSQTRVVELTETRPISLTVALDRVPASGRTQLLIAAGIGGAAFGSSALGGLFEEGSLTSAIGGAIGLGVGIGSAYLGVPDDVSVGTSSLIIGGTLLGAAEGLLVSAFFSCDAVQDEQDGTFEPAGCDSGALTGAALASGVGGLLVAALAGAQLDVSAGDAAIINSGALWGGVTGALFYAAFDQDARVDEPLIFAGLNIGLATGVLLAKRYDIGRRHSALIDLSGLAGLVAGAALADVVDEGTAERRPHFSLVGLTAGLVTGAYLTRHMDEPKTLRNLGASVGAATDVSGGSLLTLGMSGAF